MWQHVEDYRSIIKAAKSESVKAKQLAAQLIPRFFKFFPELSASAVDSHLDLCEEEELGVSFLHNFISFYCNGFIMLNDRVKSIELAARID